MEFWEGAILVVGGLWLVGRMSRSSTAKPVLSQAAAGTVTATGNTTATNTDGSSVLVAGEPLSGIAPPLTRSNQPVISGFRNSLAPVVTARAPFVPGGVASPGIHPVNTVAANPTVYNQGTTQDISTFVGTHNLAL